MQTNPTVVSGGRRFIGIFAENRPGQPLVSVITSTLNNGQSLTECLESVLSQDYPNIEHIVMDGGSTDNTIDVLRQQEDRIAFWKTEPDKGIYDAWNKALPEARGNW